MIEYKTDLLDVLIQKYKNDSSINKMNINNFDIIDDKISKNYELCKLKVGPTQSPKKMKIFPYAIPKQWKRLKLVLYTRGIVE